MVCQFAFRAIATYCPCRPAIANVYLSRFFRAYHPATGSLHPRSNLVPQGSRSFSSCSLLAVAPASLPVALTDQLSAAVTTQGSEEWLALRKDKLTASKFNTVLGFWKGSERVDLWREKVFASEEDSIGGQRPQRGPFEWGIRREATAIEKYKSITGHDVSYLGFATHPKQNFNWLGASPDGLLGCPPNEGILEVKCPFKKGNPSLAKPWSTIPFRYMPQVQGQMEILDRDWVDLYCWTRNGSTLFRVHREREYWDLIHEVLHEFWWKNVVPAKEALLAGGKKAAMRYKPSSEHKLTRKVVFKSIELANEVKLSCKEFADRVEFYT